MLTTKKSTSEQIIRKIVPYFANIHPHVLTMLSVVPALLFFWSILAHHLFIALFCMLGSSLDMLDGAVARMYKKTSIFGEVLDSTTDRVTDFLYITPFGFAHIISWEIVLLFLLLSYLVSYIRARGELAIDKKNSLAIGIMERPERIIGIFLSLLLFIIFPSISLFSLNLLSLLFLLMSILLLITVMQRLVAVKKKR